MSNKILINTDKCTGCQACVIACSFHHEKFFGRKTSSIQINGLRREGEFDIKIYDKATDGHIPCDRCSDEKEPLCLNFCSTGALRRG